jgi:hypothetical protein
VTFTPRELWRYWSKVRKTGGCWLWKGAGSPQGPALFSLHGRTVTARRVAYQIAGGDIPEGMCVCNACGNANCVRPDHLTLATHRDIPRRPPRARPAGPIRLLPGEQVRFWRKVRKPRKGCWRWLGDRGVDGSGVFEVGGRMVRVHRLSYQLHNGTIPEGKQVLHTCTDRLCVKPGHLRLGMTKGEWEKKADKRPARRGRPLGVYVGENTAHKLTADQVLTVRRRYVKDCPRDGVRALAREFGVSWTCIWLVVTGQTWTHLPLHPD